MKTCIVSLLLITTFSLVSAFDYGVASGDVTPFSAILWTRVDETTGDANRLLSVMVGTDDAFSNVTFSSHLELPSPDRDLTLQVYVDNLEPNTMYYYQFTYGSISSSIGKFRTAPSNFSIPLLFGWSGDADWTKYKNGNPVYNNFEPLGAAARENLDFFIFLGDTIYGDSYVSNDIYGIEAYDKEGYWSFYKTNRANENHRALLESTSIYVQWDDHEISNDWNDDTPINLTRANAGYAAYVDYWPISEYPGNLSDPGCIFYPMFRYFQWGPDIDLIILDERSCRTPSDLSDCQIGRALGTDLYYPFPLAPADVRTKLLPGLGNILDDFTSFLLDLLGLDLRPDPPSGCVDVLRDPSRSILGKAQKQEFKNILLNSTAAWKFVVNEVPMAQTLFQPYDTWEGFVAERTEILTFIRDNNISNVVFLTTDLHLNLIMDVYVDIFSGEAPVAKEIVVGPIGTFSNADFVRYIIENSALDIGDLSSRLGDEVNEYSYNVVDYIGVSCSNVDIYAYGTVQFTPDTKQITVSIKDSNGNVVKDGRNSSLPCTITLNPK